VPRTWRAESDGARWIVLTRVAQLMPADGFLLLGAAETVVGVTDVFAPMESARGLYVKSATAKPEAMAKISAA